MDKDITNVLGRMDKLLNPHHRWQEHIHRKIEPQRRFQELMEKHLEPQRRFQELMEKHLEPQRRFQELMEKHLEPQRRFQELMEKHLEPQRRLQEQMNKYLEPQRRLQEQMNKYLEPQRLLQGQINRYLNPLNEYLSNPLMDSVVVGKNGEVTVSEERVNIREINASVESLSGDYSSTQEFLEQLFILLEKLSNGARTFILYSVLSYFIAITANLTTPLYGEWWKEYADYNHREAKKEIIRDAHDLFRTEELFEYRFVYASMLNVRESGSTKSKVVGELHLGKAVKLIKKAKSWSFIEYQDFRTSEVKRGWVFSRYLRKFEK